MTRISKALLLSALLLVFSSMATMAATPSTAPVEGDMAVSFNAGFVKAFDDDFDGTEPVFTGTFEYYTDPRISWRGLLGVTSIDADIPGVNASVDITFVNANVLYNWEGGWIHPYVTGGVGLYQKDASSNLPSEFDETVFGANGGGIDWFLGSRWALKFEGTFHTMTGENPNTAFLGTAGFMFWF